MVNPTGLPRYNMAKHTDEERDALEPDSFGNPQKIGIYDNSDDHTLGGGHRHVTVIHAPTEAVFVVKVLPYIDRSISL